MLFVSTELTSTAPNNMNFAAARQTLPGSPTASPTASRKLPLIHAPARGHRSAWPLPGTREGALGRRELATVMILRKSIFRLFCVSLLLRLDDLGSVHAARSGLITTKSTAEPPAAVQRTLLNSSITARLAVQPAPDQQIIYGGPEARDSVKPRTTGLSTFYSSHLFEVWSEGIGNRKADSHKPLFPLNYRDGLALVFASVALFVAAGGGIGGGGVLVPLFILGLRKSPPL